MSEPEPPPREPDMPTAVDEVSTEVEPMVPPPPSEVVIEAETARPRTRRARASIAIAVRQPREPAAE